VTEGRRHLSKNGLHNLCSSRNKIRMIKSRRIGLAGCSTRGKKVIACRVFVEKLEGQDRGHWRALASTVMNLRIL
jgi:hypothetical protein